MALKSIYQFGPEDRSKESRAPGAIIDERLRIPVLKTLYDLGADSFRPNQEVINVLEGLINLQDADRIVHNNKQEWLYRIEWAYNELRNAGLIVKDPDNYQSWKITDTGVKYLAQFGLMDSTEVEESILVQARKRTNELIAEIKASKAEQLKAEAVNIILVMQRKMGDLRGGESFGDWKFVEVTNKSFGSPGGGGWNADEFEGYKFKNDKLDKEFLIRFVTANREYIVVESFTTHSQIVNYRLDNKGKIELSDDITRLLEDCSMTVRYKVKKKEAKNALVRAGFNADLVITEFDTLEENEDKFLEDVLNWANFREEAKGIIRSEREELPDAGPDPEDDEEDGEERVEAYNPNIILYGPPGTGKTYNTIDRSVKIVDPKQYKSDDHEHNKDVFDDLVEEGRIVFTTFHQSMGYEDFIEGIKAETDDDGSIRYEVKPGIFKRLVNKAKESEVVGENFEATYQKLMDEIKKNDGSLVLETTQQGKEYTIYENRNGNIRFHPNTEAAYPATIKKEYVRIYLETGETVDWPSYIKGVGKYMVDELGYRKETKDAKKNYVLIIDEINRGNVSNIFGELITLIEKDKRVGGDNELEVTLPYSPKERFSVPGNLYILGTMNTADRSVEALDTALRRRFVFEEIMPEPKKITDDNDDPVTVVDENNKVINLQDLLSLINKRIEVLIDRDHTIGHSYFMDVKDLGQLKLAFENKIIPLLQEYFYGDYGKIGLVLGKEFVEITKKDPGLFADFKYTGKEELNQPVYKLVEFKKVNFSKAVQTLLGKQVEEEQPEVVANEA